MNRKSKIALYTLGGTVILMGTVATLHATSFGKHHHDFGSHMQFVSDDYEDGDRRHGKRRRGRGGEHRQAILEMLDINGDKEISKDELESAIKSRFAEADADKNGKLNEEETAIAVQKLMARHMAKRGIKRLDGDGDGELSLDEILDKAKMGFEHFDRNDDGVVNGDDRKRKGWW